MSELRSSAETGAHTPFITLILPDGIIHVSMMDAARNAASRSITCMNAFLEIRTRVLLSQLFVIPVNTGLHLFQKIHHQRPARHLVLILLGIEIVQLILVI